MNNNELTKGTIWEENDLIEQEKNCLNNNVVEQNDITNVTKKDSIENQWIDTGKVSGIYKIINKVNGKYYVGSSDNVYNRWLNHKRALKRIDHCNNHLQNSWNKNGENNFDFLLVENVVDLNLLDIEQKYLDIAKKEQHKCYNQSFIAGRIDMTPVVREKIRISHLGNKNPMYGKKLSENHLKIIRERGKKIMTTEYAKWVNKCKTKKQVHTEETKKKLSDIASKRIGSLNGMYGKHHSEETKKKISGKNHPLYNHTVYNFVNKRTEETFIGTQFEFYKKYSLDQTWVRNLVNKQKNIKSVKNWIVL